MTNVPMPSFGDAGFTSPSELATYDGVIADFNAAFGGNLNPSKTTPQGQLATSLTAVIGAFNDLFIDFTNQVDPAFASGRMQDALGRLYYLTRKGATSTTVTATVTGRTGLVLSAGSLAKTADGAIFQSMAAVTIPSAGSVDVPFAAIETGPIPCPAGSLNMIYRTAVGWDAVNNASAGILGTVQEGRDAFEERRSLSVAANARAIVAAIRGAVLSVDGVVDAFVTENDTGAPVVKKGVTLAAHSVYVCVQGGTNAAVGKAIWTRKSGGCAMNGSTSVTVYDDESGYETPPAYTILFDRPATLAMDFEVDILTGPQVPGDAGAQIEDAIAAKFAELARIGQDMFASSFVCAIAALGSWVRIRSIAVNGGDSQIVDNDEIPVLGTVTVTAS